LIINMWYLIDIFTNNHLQMEYDNFFEVGLFLDFQIYIFVIDEIKY